MGGIKINGDNNQVYNKVKNSRINSDDTITNSNTTKKWIAVTSLIVAILGFIVTCIKYWDSISQLFN
jgi:hypothetical protein